MESSGNCISVQRQCEYPPAVLPLRERRKKCLPGEQQPWIDASTMPKVIGSCTSVAMRPIPMAYRSDELFHYCKPARPIESWGTNEGKFINWKTRSTLCQKKNDKACKDFDLNFLTMGTD